MHFFVSFPAFMLPFNQARCLTAPPYLNVANPTKKELDRVMQISALCSVSTSRWPR